MRVSVEKIENCNKRNKEVLAYKALYEFLVFDQDKSWDRWEKHSEHLTENQRFQKKKDFGLAVSNSKYTELVWPKIDKNGKIEKWHDSFVIALMRGQDEIDVTCSGSPTKDLSFNEEEVSNDTQEEEDASAPDQDFPRLETEDPEQSLQGSHIYNDGEASP